MEKIAYMLDFDGTVTAADISTELARRYGGTHFEAVEEAYRRREFGMRVWLEKIAAFLPADLHLLLSLSLQITDLRPGFSDFLKFARENSRPVYIASDGLGFYIEPLLRERSCFEYIEQIYCNRSVAFGEILHVVTDHAHNKCAVCGNCKASHVVKLQAEGYRVIYAGDGSNDRFASSWADYVFARDRLAAACSEKGIPFEKWQDFHDLMKPCYPVLQANGSTCLCFPGGDGVIPGEIKPFGES